MADLFESAIFFTVNFKYICKKYIVMQSRRKPEWLKIKLTHSEDFNKINTLLKNNNLHTICTSGKCPNMGECWKAGTATFMILGDICSRNCKFCAVTPGKPSPADLNEPIKLARSIKSLNLKHCVITSVTRDDLVDEGAGIWADTIINIKRENPLITIETLIPDFNYKTELIDSVIEASPDVISHNLETVESLTPKLRSRATYARSLDVLNYISKSGIRTKTGIMVGVGETKEEVLKTMDDSLNAGVKIFTIGQYLQPRAENYPVIEYITPDLFDEYKQVGLEKGFEFVESGPMVRSSYHAERHIK